VKPRRAALSPNHVCRAKSFASKLRAICEIVWLVASEHLYNMTNIGLNIHSDMLCDISSQNLNVSQVET
jgi:hypothetical protein